MSQERLSPRAPDASDKFGTERAVVVTNISARATEANLQQFFSFCGSVQSISIASDPQAVDGSQRAVVTFSQSAEAGTALLLSGATIVDQPIVISKYSAPVVGVAAVDSSNTAQSPPPPAVAQTTPASSGERRPSTVIASLLAAGFMLADEALEKAKAFDAEHLNLQRKAEEVRETVKAKADELHVGDKLRAVSLMAASKLDAVDERLQVKQKAGALIDTVTNTAEKLKSKALENDVVRAGYDFVFGLVSRGAHALQEVADETQTMIHERQRQAATQVAPGTVPMDDVVTATVAPVQPEAAAMETAPLLQTSAPSADAQSDAV